METHSAEITYDVELRVGERLTLPEEALGIVGPGRWQVSIRPAPEGAPQAAPRVHAAFLNGYAPADEGLYDDYPAG